MPTRDPATDREPGNRRRGLTGGVGRLRAAEAITNTVEETGLYGLRHGGVAVEIETFCLKVGRDFVNRANAASRSKQVEKIEEEKKCDDKSPRDSARGRGQKYRRFFADFQCGLLHLQIRPHGKGPPGRGGKARCLKRHCPSPGVL